MPTVVFAATAAAARPVVNGAIAPEEPRTEDDVGLKIIELFQYNVFFDLPKAHKVFPAVSAPLPAFVYGPYQWSTAFYLDKPPVDEIERRILALEEVLRAVKPGETNLAAMKIHLADLKAMKSRATMEMSDLSAAIAAYAGIYQDADPRYAPYVDLNMADALLLVGDTVTALPIIKKIYKDFSAYKDLRKHLDASLVELYFLSGRYEKAWAELEGFVRHKEVADESPEYRLRVGDVLFFMKRYQEAADWYQSVLTPQDTSTYSENVSWLYLAESLWRLGNAEVAGKIFSAMGPYFKGTGFGDVIRARLNPGKAGMEAVLKDTASKAVKNWVHVENLKEEFRASPSVLAGGSFNYLLVDQDYPEELRRQLIAMQAYAFTFEKKYYTAIKLYQKLALDQKSPVIQTLIDEAIVEALKKKGRITSDEKQAYAFLKFLRKYEFRLRTVSPDEVFELIGRNLDLMGMKDVAAEMTLHIVDKSIHGAKDKSLVYLKLAGALFRAGATRAGLKASEQVDVALLDFAEKDETYRMRLEGLTETLQYKDALDLIARWEAEGASAKNVYWLALKKVEVDLKMDKPDEALAAVESSVGSGKVNFLPRELDATVNELLSWQVMLKNKVLKHHEALTDFYANQERILKTDSAAKALMAALSSALAMNKKNDVAKLMAAAKEAFDPETYEWLGQWTRGELWINQINGYLDQRTAAKVE
jgi:tetratricopeptide (TPR) repeat protein